MNIRNDAPVLDLGNGTALISATDFFKPVVDNLHDYGRIVCATIISDVYARGGKPLTATAMLGWPVDQLSQETAYKVLDGARAICAEAGIILSEEHHINTAERLFGLAINGLVNTRQLIYNSTATSGCRLYLTKPLGIGILSTAQKKGLLKPEDAAFAIKTMVTLNKSGHLFSQMESVKAMTTINSSGLLGHLAEMCEKSGLSAVIEFNKVPAIHSLTYYLGKNCYPEGTHENWDNYGHKISRLTEEQISILADPQTSGGLLVAVADEGVEMFEQFLISNQINARSFGWLREPTGGKLIEVV